MDGSEEAGSDALKQALLAHKDACRMQELNTLWQELQRPLFAYDADQCASLHPLNQVLYNTER